MEKKPLSHIVAGVIIGAVMIVYSMFLQLADLSNNKPLAYLSYVITIAMLVFFILQFGKANNNDKTFGQLFSYGFKASAVSAIISIAFMAIFFIVFPEYQEKIWDNARTEMAKNPQITEAQIEQGVEIGKKFFWIFLIAGGIFITMLIGAIGSLIGAGVAKKNPPSPFQQA
jgi:amino acid transporter